MVKLRVYTDAVGRNIEILQPLGYRNGTSGSPFRKRWAVAGVPLIILFLFVASAESGVVYGRISKENVILGNRTFVLIDESKGNSVNVQTDLRGNYSVMIPAGVYRARYTDEVGEWEAQVWSYPNATQQDIQLRRRK